VEGLWVCVWGAALLTDRAVEVAKRSEAACAGES
jgi:hypothetical protein